MILKRSEVFKRCLDWCARYFIEDKKLLKPAAWGLNNENFQNFSNGVCEKDQNRCQNKPQKCEERLKRGLKRLGIINIKNNEIVDIHYAVYFLILDYKRRIAYQYIPSIKNKILESRFTKESSRKVKLPFGEGVVGYFIEKWRKEIQKKEIQKEGKSLYSIHFDARQEFLIEDRLQLIDSIFCYPLYFEEDKEKHLFEDKEKHLFGVILFTSFFRGVFEKYSDNNIKEKINQAIDKINDVISFSIIPSLAQDLDALQIEIDNKNLAGTDEDSLKEYMEEIIPILMKSEVLDLCGITFESKGKLLACGFSSAVLAERIKRMKEEEKKEEKIKNFLKSLSFEELQFSINNETEYILSFYFDKNQNLELNSLSKLINEKIEKIKKGEYVKYEKINNEQASSDMKLYSSFDITHLVNKKIEEFLCDIINYIHPLPPFELKQYWEEFFPEDKEDIKELDKKNDKEITDFFKKSIKNKYKWGDFDFCKLNELSQQTILITLTKNKSKMRLKKRQFNGKKYEKLFEGLNAHYHENLASKIHQELLKAQKNEKCDQIGLLPAIFLNLEGYSYFWKDEEEFKELLEDINSIVFLFGKEENNKIKFEWVSSFDKVDEGSYNYILSLYFKEKIEEECLNSFSYEIKKEKLNSIKININNKSPIIIALYQLEKKESIICVGINYNRFVEKLKDNKITLKDLIGESTTRKIELKINNSESFGKLTFYSTYETNLKTKRFSDFLEYFKNSLESEYKLKMEEEKREKYAKGSAAMSILMESYGHNIGTHGLEGLKVYLKKQWEDIKKCLNLNEEDKEKFIESLLAALKSGNKSLEENIKNIIKTHINFSEYLWYLQGKSAFWSAIARGGALFGGKTITVLQLISNFAQNNLLCGSLGASEEFKGIEFYIKLNESGLVNLYTSTIESFNKKNDSLESKLEKISIYMPEGVVGQQAVYTIWENIIRNVKHCKKDNKDLIPFCIEIKDENKEYIEIACWLDLDSQRDEELGNKVNEMNEWMGILDKNQKPNMGGTSQNILCAGMVFGVDFIKTEKLQLQKEADKKVMRFELSDDNRIKFCFKIWKGKDVGKYEDIANKKIEEIGPLGRFRIIQLKDENEKNNLLKNPFFLRHVIYENTSDLKKLYQKWIEEWLKDELKNGIKIIIDRINGIDEKSHFNNFNLIDEKSHFNNFNFKLENKGSNQYKYCFFHREPSQGCQILQKLKIQIYYHGSDAIGKIINGIILKERPNDNIYQGLLELLEILETGIEIFDNRLDILAKKIENKTPKLKELKVWVFPEEEEKLKSLKNADKIHFGIFHLSFIELITGKKNDEAIKEFFNDYSYFKERYKIIIITTGRGRDWWNGLDEELKMKIKFIPIENLESCFDKTLAPKTPSIGVKYALVKTIFGS
jgi:hypothetical protein